MKKLMLQSLMAGAATLMLMGAGAAEARDNHRGGHDKWHDRGYHKGHHKTHWKHKHRHRGYHPVVYYSYGPFYRPVAQPVFWGPPPAYGTRIVVTHGWR